MRMQLRGFAGRLSAAITLVLSLHSPVVHSEMTDQLPPGNQLEEALIDTAWTGMVFGERFDYLFLDDHKLVYQTKKGVFAKSKWGLSQGGKLLIAIINNPDYLLQLSLTGELQDGQIVGSAKHFLSTVRGQSAEQRVEEAPWVLERISPPFPELLEAAPPNHYPASPLPRPNLVDFSGTYVSISPTADRQNDLPLKYEIRCELGTGCSKKIAGKPHDVFDGVGPLNRDGYRSVKRSLEAARSIKSVALQLEPWLSKLLESDAQILDCLELRRTKQTGGVSRDNKLCRLDKNPWTEPVLLYQAGTLDHCVTAGCRYGFVPMFKVK